MEKSGIDTIPFEKFSTSCEAIAQTASQMERQSLVNGVWVMRGTVLSEEGKQVESPGCDVEASRWLFTCAEQANSGERVYAGGNLAGCQIV